MPFNDNQLFYAALYWAEALPHGLAFTDDICKKYNMPYMQMHASQQRTDVECHFNPFEDDHDEFLLKQEKVRWQVETGISQKEAEVFFDAIYAFLKEDKPYRYPAYSGDGAFLKLCLSDEEDDDENAVKHALQVTGLNHEILYRDSTVCWVHDNGQLFCMPGNTFDKHNIIDVPYPGRPETGYRSVPDFSVTDGIGCEATVVQIEHFFRVVEFKAGQTFKRRLSDGGWSERDYETKEGDFYTVSHQDVDGDLADFTDEQLISGQDPRVHNGLRIYKNDREMYQSGYIDEHDGYTIEATDDPRIVRQLQAPMRCMTVTEKMQIKYGGHFELAEPGDKIIFDERGNRTIVIRKKHIESGIIRLVTPKPGGKPPAPPKP